jgi:hypothetical protein
LQKFLEQMHRHIPPTHYTARKSGLDNRGTPEAETRTTVEAVSQEPPKSVVGSLSEE